MWWRLLDLCGSIISCSESSMNAVGLFLRGKTSLISVDLFSKVVTLV